ncbi:MAG: hypothetical protein QXP31_00215 [Pyrobaculum sp.]
MDSGGYGQKGGYVAVDTSDQPVRLYLATEQVASYARFALRRDAYASPTSRY